ncbi:hypothetical protein F9C07_7201 [Aspergillus flavus]|uniref:Uncharacterized protein n=1 Tax=Aspergillus flavus (strain ATCC 200026 / FGSC A1120 / IAM 13836 / NRRL 3357 / JCM 12722 / SRRC 167) TaxID=332952 RepID=A0A7U2QXD7_ASPFN|nr:hypothetical protein F9C07_7201 [Aspergillus flavus]
MLLASFLVFFSSLCCYIMYHTASRAPASIMSGHKSRHIQIIDTLSVMYISWWLKRHMRKSKDE